MNRRSIAEDQQTQAQLTVQMLKEARALDAGHHVPGGQGEEIAGPRDDAHRHRGATARRIEAAELHRQARQIFAGPGGPAHSDLEEASVALDDEISGKMRRCRAQESLNFRAQTRCPKGMSDTLRFLAVDQFLSGSERGAVEALKLYLAARGMYPLPSLDSQGQPSFRLGLSDIAKDVITRLGGIKAYQGRVIDLREKAETRQGAFVYLNSVSDQQGINLERAFETLPYIAQGK